MSKFILKKDWVIKSSILGKVYEKTLYKKGQVIEPNEKGNYMLKDPDGGGMYLKYEDMKSAMDGDELLFEEFKEKIKDIQLTVLEEDYEDVERNFRLQLDVKTTAKKAREIENYLRKTLIEML